jgi:hypothetical protein
MVYLDWEAAADEQVSRLRAVTNRWGADDAFAALMDEMRTAQDFTNAVQSSRRPKSAAVRPTSCTQTSAD